MMMINNWKPCWCFDDVEWWIHLWHTKAGIDTSPMRVNNLNSLWKSFVHTAVCWSWSCFWGCKERWSRYWTNPFLLFWRVVEGLKDIVCTGLEGDRHLQAEIEVGLIEGDKRDDKNQTKNKISERYLRSPVRIRLSSIGCWSPSS